MSSPATTIPTIPVEIDLELHILPVLHLSRMAISMEDMLRQIDQSREFAPKLDDTLKNLGCLTAYGTSVADYADMAILSAITLLKAYAEAQRLGGAA